MGGMYYRRLKVSTYPALHIALRLHRPQSMFAGGVCDFGATFSSGSTCGGWSLDEGMYLSFSLSLFVVCASLLCTLKLVYVNC